MVYYSVLSCATKQKKNPPPTGIRYKLFRLWWMWKHRNWMPTRQKTKALHKEWEKRNKKR
jgi:hypothetical protein